jgi:hypothetical protein
MSDDSCIQITLVRPSYWIQLRNYQGGLIWDRRMLDTLAPGHFGTCVRHFGTKTNRHPDNSNAAPQLDKSAPLKDNSALVFFSLILCTKLPSYHSATVTTLLYIWFLIVSFVKKKYQRFAKKKQWINIFRTRYMYFRSGIINVQNWRVCEPLKCILAIQKQLTNRPKGKPTSWSVFSYIIHFHLQQCFHFIFLPF